MQNFERPYKKVSIIKSVIYFLFCNKAFISMSVQHDQAWILSTSPDLRGKYIKGDYNPNIKDIEESAKLRTIALRHSLTKSALLVTISIALAIMLGQILKIFLGEIPSNAASVFQIGGAGILLWAAIWELGWNVRSVGGESLPERVHQWLFRLMSFIGTFFLFLAAGWSL